jgi:tRNA A37 threonylcarbamoyladenosine biosynthesis protein TsaE
VVVVEWAEKLGKRDFEAETVSVTISGDGDGPREIEVKAREHLSLTSVK